MGRKPGFDEKKIASIISVLYQNPDGIWLSKIAEKAGLHPTTVTKYVEGALRPLVEDTTLAGPSKPILRVIRLKSSVLEELAKGKDIQQIMKLLKIMSSYK